MKKEEKREANKQKLFKDAAKDREINNEKRREKWEGNIGKVRAEERMNAAEVK